jgi:hypothetical protein
MCILSQPSENFKEYGLMFSFQFYVQRTSFALNERNSVCLKEHDVVFEPISKN